MAIGDDDSVSDILLIVFCNISTSFVYAYLPLPEHARYNPCAHMPGASCYVQPRAICASWFVQIFGDACIRMYA
jgi:hypothetical protein